MKKFVVVVLALVMALNLAACGGNANKPDSSDGSGTSGEQKQYTLNVSGIDGGFTLFPVYLAQEKGWFEEAGLTINRTGFTNGPVQMEAIDTWDIGTTGVGGVLSGTISYDAVILGVVGSDDGTQAIFIRPDTAPAKVGTGFNTVNPEIIGDAASWKGMKINATYGTVVHYMLLKTLGGFGLTADDVSINWMDAPTCNAAFLAGEGDATCTSGIVSFSADKAEFLRASSGPMANTGLITNIMANPKSLADPEKREAMKIFLDVFFKTSEWITANPEEATQYMMDWCDYAGNTIDEETAYLHCTVDTYYTLEDNYEVLHAEALDGGSYTRMQEQVLGILNFFIETESYQKGDNEIFLQEKHFDTTLIDELYAEK